MKEKEMSEITTIDKCDCFLNTPEDNHEPPIGFGGGSFFMDIPSLRFNVRRDSANDTATHKRYVAFGTSPGHRRFTKIHSVAVMAEAASGSNIRFERFTFPENTAFRPILRMWLGTGATAPGANAEVTVQGGGTSAGAGDGFIFITEEFDQAENTTKNIRKERNRHHDPNIKVIKWDLVDARTSPETPIMDPGTGMAIGSSGDDLYYLYVSFHHN